MNNFYDIITELIIVQILYSGADYIVDIDRNRIPHLLIV